MKKKSIFEFPYVKIESFSPSDIITTSGAGDDQKFHGDSEDAGGGFFDE